MVILRKQCTGHNTRFKVPSRKYCLGRNDFLTQNTLNYSARRYVPDILDMLKKGKLEPLVPIPTISMVQAVCRLLEGLLPGLADKTSEVCEACFVPFRVVSFRFVSFNAGCDGRGGRVGAGVYWYGTCI